MFKNQRSSAVAGDNLSTKEIGRLEVEELDQLILPSASPLRAPVVNTEPNITCGGVVADFAGGDGNDSFWFTKRFIENHPAQFADGLAVINLGAGNDRGGVESSPGGIEWKFCGDEGRDRILGSRDPNDTNHLAGGPGDDNIQIRGGQNNSAGGDQGRDRITGSNQNDLLIGGPGNDIIKGKGGDDIIDGEAGDDKLFGDNGNDMVIGGDGSDLLKGGKGNDNLFGGDQFDKIFGGDGDDWLKGDGGDDLLKGNRGAYLIEGGIGEDRFARGLADDRLKKLKHLTTPIDPGTGINVLFGGDVITDLGRKF